jgi:transcriptional regulator with XRE-family HTH domain
MGMDRNSFGLMLKDWRGRRRMSQLDLALDAGVSARHLAFLETGRAKPSRDMVDQLIDALEVPHRERNDFLLTAGFAPAYSKLSLDDPSLMQVRKGLDRLLDSHAPWPALMLDRDWNIVKVNRTAGMLLSLIGGQEDDLNLLTRLADAPRVADVIENWHAVAQEFARRLRSEALQFADVNLLKRVEAFQAKVLKDITHADEAPGPLLNMTVRVGEGTRLSLFSILGQFSSALDVTAAELRVELFFPADEATRKFLEQL